MDALSAGVVDPEVLERREIELLGETKRVYVSGAGPAVIVMAEMPGIYAHVLRFARMVRDAGFTVWMPALFGTEGGPVTIPGGLMTLARACTISSPPATT